MGHSVSEPGDNSLSKFRNADFDFDGAFLSEADEESSDDEGLLLDGGGGDDVAYNLVLLLYVSRV